MTATGRPPRILIVDDDDDSRVVFEIILARDGFAISTAASGALALASMLEQLPELVLVDVFKPEISGYDLTEQLKANSATMQIPVIMVSGLGDQNAKTRALAAGAVKLLTKPVMREELCLQVRQCLDARRG